MLMVAPFVAARTWCRPWIEAPRNWPQLLLDPALTAVAPADDALDVPSVRAAAPSPLTDALRRVGVASWRGIVLRVGERTPGLLGSRPKPAQAVRL